MKGRKRWNEEGAVLKHLCIEMNDWYTDAVLKNCVVEELNISGGENEGLIIENCVVDRFSAIGTSFNGSVIIRNSIFREELRFIDSGYNKQEIIIENNVFLCHADFFDEVFEAPFILRNNILLDGTNLFGFQGESCQVTFRSGYTVEGNLGQLDFEG